MNPEAKKTRMRREIRRVELRIVGPPTEQDVPDTYYIIVTPIEVPPRALAEFSGRLWQRGTKKPSLSDALGMIFRCDAPTTFRPTIFRRHLRDRPGKDRRP